MLTRFTSTSLQICGLTRRRQDNALYCFLRLESIGTLTRKRSFQELPRLHRGTNPECLKYDCVMNSLDIKVRSLSDGKVYRAPVSAFPKADSRDGIEIVRGEEMATPKSTIKITFDYPLTKSTELTFTQNGGFTRRDLYRAIYDGYQRIYSAEPDPGTIPGMANRARSTGPYGIYGHYLEDLIIGGVYEVRPGFFQLDINS